MPRPRSNGTPAQAPTPRRMDTERVSKLAEPLTVQLHRLAHDPNGAALPPEPIPLPDDGINWTRERVLGLETGTARHSGGGRYEVTVIDANQTVEKGQFLVPGPPVIPAETRMDAAVAQHASRSAAFAAAQTNAPPVVTAPMGPPMDPFGRSGYGQQNGFSQPGPPLPPAAGYGGGPMDPFGRPGYGGGGYAAHAAPQVQGTYHPQGPQMPPYWPPPPQPQNPYQYYSPPPYQQPYQQPWEPPSKENERLKEEVARLREQITSRTASESGERVAERFSSSIERFQSTVLNALEKQTDQFRAILERMASNGGAGNQVQALEQSLRDMNYQRQQDLERLSHQQREQQLQAELKAIKEGYVREIAELRASIQTTSAAQSETEKNHLIDRVTAITAQANERLQQVYEKAQAQTPPLETMLKLFSELRGNDEWANRLKEMAIESAMAALGGGGGQPSTAQVIAQLGGALIEQVGQFGQAYAVGRATNAQQAQLLERRARARVSGGGGQRAVKAQAQAQPLAGAVGVEPASNVIPMPPRPPQNAEEALALEEGPYFGDAYSQVKQLRNGVAANLVPPRMTVQAVVQAFIHFQQFGIQIPALADLVTRPEIAIDRLLPDADLHYKKAVLAALPEAMQAAIDDLREKTAALQQEAAAAAEVDGGEAEEDGDAD